MKDFLKVATQHWKTSTAGVAAGLAVIAGSYQHGMTVSQWALAAILALFGLVAHDGKVTTP